LIEVLVTIGIIVVLVSLALPAILMSRKRGIEIRAKADLNLISTALEAYKGDFGSYPVFADAATVQASQNVNGSGYWLDQMPVRGGVLLCRALVGPGPADYQPSTGYANPGDDGADGPGFRIRRNIVNNGSSTPAFTGKVYGPYIDPAKFKYAYVDNLKGQAFVPGIPTAFPVIIDGNGEPILYYPAAPGNPTTALSYSDPRVTTTNAVSRFNGYDNQGFLDSTGGTSTFSTTSSFAVIAANAGSLNYLLWTAGPDTQFGLVNGKTDDVTNFDIPGNLKK
jgi:type II secretory pathway pseudopilin PulG